jgi:hypothetical protein
MVMQKKIKPAPGKTARKGDTGRTSSQGRKLSTGGEIKKKGSPELDENTKSPKADLKKASRSALKRG